jgi:membrane-bound lytic murein transglycosylase B
MQGMNRSVWILLTLLAGATLWVAARAQISAGDAPTLPQAPAPAASAAPDAPASAAASAPTPVPPAANSASAVAEPAAPAAAAAPSVAAPASRPPPVANTPYGSRDDVARFAEELAGKHPQLQVKWLREQLAQARYQASVARLIMPPPAGTAKNWATYRARFVESQRIDAGAAFWRNHADTLARAEARFGVPAHIIVGIVGVETFYGRVLGTHRVLDALATLSFDFPTGRRDRTPFFRSELEAFLLWCDKEGRDPSSVRGSYAGAMGWPQFMPSSILKFAVDFDGDGRIDLHNSMADVIGSVANYMAAFGWQPGLPTHFRVNVPSEPAQRATLLAPDIKPTFTARQFSEMGAALAEEAYADAGLLALVELQNGDEAPSYVAGSKNFYVVTRYNWSAYYAMAVIDLGAAVAMRVR